MQSKDYWGKVYQTKGSDAVCWFQPHAYTSVGLINATDVGRDARICDVGGGATTLVDDLLANGYTKLTVLDLSASALEAARSRLGSSKDKVHWIEADITEAALPANCLDVWHDRAVFHFLTDTADRTAYVRAVFNSVKTDGHVIIATFAEDGPNQCSGLPVMRYRPDELHAEFGGSFSLTSHTKEAHLTPSGTVQQFNYCYCRRSVS